MSRPAPTAERSSTRPQTSAVRPAARRSRSSARTAASTPPRRTRYVRRAARHSRTRARRAEVARRAGRLRRSRVRDRAARLDFVGILTVRRRHPFEEDVQRAVLRLPDVAELVRQQVVGRLAQRSPEQDRPPERVAAVALHAGQAKQPWHGHYANTLDRNRARIEAERLQSGPCLLDARAPLVGQGSSRRGGRAP